MYPLLDWFFALFHGALAVFNLTGWIWPTTRRLHLASISLTFLSWFGLGVFFGWGYCPCTDWHWRVKRQLGERDLPSSYVKYYADALTGIDWDPRLIYWATVLLAALAFALSCWLNGRDWKRRGKKLVSRAGNS